MFWNFLYLFNNGFMSVQMELFILKNIHLVFPRNLRNITQFNQSLFIQFTIMNN